MTGDTVLKGEKCVNALTNVINNSKVHMWVNFPKKFDKFV